MEHKHGVYDSDTRFSINPITRQIKNDSNRKIVLIQNDHNSEVFTFECDKTVEGHDMEQCNVVEVHYLNATRDGKRQKSGLYTVQDFRAEGDKVVCSWVIDHNATGLVGSLNFLLVFKCVENGTITYAWHTAIYSGITVSDGINADEMFESDYVDVIERWKAKVMAHFTADLAAWKEITAAEVREEAFEDIVTERKRIDLLSNYVTPEMFGAVGDGVTDDSVAIQTTIDNCPAFSTIVFQRKTYCVSEPVNLNKKINIIGQGAVLKATQSMDCVLHLTNQGSLNPYSIIQLTVDANNFATVGVRVGGDNHATQITFRECVAKNAIDHGFHVLPIAYIINFVSCLASNNGGDGLNAVAPDSSNQINAINIEKCSFQHNAESGLNVNGVSFSITECDSEFNKYGITVGGVNYVTYGIFIVNCHIEFNEVASIYVDTKSVATVTVKRCYLYQTSEYSEDSGATAFIKCTKSAYDISLGVEENVFQGNAALNYVDGGNKLGVDSVIRVGDINRLVNMKNAKIDAQNTGEKYLPIPMSLSSGAGFTDCSTSVNLVGTEAPRVKMVVPYNLVNALPRIVGVYVETDGTTATLRCFAKKYNADGKTVIQQTYYDQIITETGLFTFNLLNNWGYKRIPNNAYMELEFVLTEAGNAKTVILSNPYVTVYQ